MTGAASKDVGCESCMSRLSRRVYCVAVVFSTGKVGSRLGIGTQGHMMSGWE